MIQTVKQCAIDHIHQCRSCKLSAYPSGERMHDRHVAVRLGDARFASYKVFLNGADVTTDTVEAIAGDDGHVWMLSCIPEHHLCSCGAGVCEIERMGKVEIVRQ